MQKKLKTLAAAIVLIVASGAAYSVPQEPGVVVTVEGTKVTAFWNPVIGAQGYTLYWAPYPALTPITAIDMGSSTDITVDLAVGRSLAIAVKARDISGESGFSNIESFTVESPNLADANASVSDIISHTTANVILATYEDLADKSRTLLDELGAFQFNRTDAKLQRVQFAWRDARRSWEQTESFLFGPVDTQGLDPALDSWPVNRTDLDAVLNSGNTLSLDFVKALDDTLHGFHTIEYLIFGEANNKRAANFTARETEYLAATTGILNEHAQILANAWRPTGGNFLAEVANAGKGSATYPSEIAALQELVNGMVGIVDEVGNGKIADPFSQTNTELVESQFSFNSLLDFENNIRGVENIYLGRYLKKDGPGLNDLVRRNNADLDAQIRGAFDAAIDAIQAIPFPFRDSISHQQGRILIEAAQLKIADLQAVLEGNLSNNIASYQ